MRSHLYSLLIKGHTVKQEVAEIKIVPKCDEYRGPSHSCGLCEILMIANKVKVYWLLINMKVQLITMISVSHKQVLSSDLQV